MSLQLEAGALVRILNKKIVDTSLSRSQVNTLIAIRNWIGGATENLELSKDRTGVPSQALCFFKDGNQICCVFGDFINLQESPAGFGIDYDSAVADLEKQHKKTTQGE